MRSLGIDPGTGNFDFCCIEDDVERVVLDESIPSNVVAEETDRVLKLILEVAPTCVVAPSGYGLAFKKLSEVTDEELALTTLEKKTDSGIGVLSGVRRLLKGLRKENVNAYVVPGVIQLPSVPDHRKKNKIDMGTADKTCVTAYAVWDQSRARKLRYDETCLICVEMGYGYNAAMAVENGEIVDGLGGTIFPGPGFLSIGAMDGELAYLINGFSKKLLFRGGASYLDGFEGLTVDDFVNNREGACTNGWRLFIEGVVKAVAALSTSIDRKPLEIILTGRLSRVKEIRETISKVVQRKLGIRCRRPINVFAQKAKDVAMGAALISNGIEGGKYSELVEIMRIRESRGTVLDHIILPGFHPAEIIRRLRND